MAITPEELALDLSSTSVRAQEQSEIQLRERATAVLAAASILVPVAALAIGHRTTGVAIPFGVAALAYALCVLECGAALIPRGVHFGLLGGQLLETATASGASLRQLQAAAASYLDEGYEYNRGIIDHARKRVARAIFLLTIETLALASALLVTLVG